MELSLLILVCIHKSYIVYLEIYVVLIGHGFSFFWVMEIGEVMENQCWKRGGTLSVGPDVSVSMPAEFPRGPVISIRVQLSSHGTAMISMHAGIRGAVIRSVCYERPGQRSRCCWLLMLYSSVCELPGRPSNVNTLGTLTAVRCSCTLACCQLLLWCMLPFHCPLQLNSAHHSFPTQSRT